jgi:hypothetical protein
LKPKKQLIIDFVHCDVLAEALRKEREHREYHRAQPDGGTTIKGISTWFALRIKNNGRSALRIKEQSMKEAVK